LANEVVLLHKRVAGVSGRQIGGLKRHLTGAVTRRQIGLGSGSDGDLVEFGSRQFATGRDRAGIREAFGGDLGAFTSRSADSAAAIEDQTFRARVTGDAVAFAHQILVTRFVVGVDHVSDIFAATLESRFAQTSMTFANDAVDAAVSAAGDGRYIFVNG